MSYHQAMKWGRKHPKGTHQDVICSAHGGFTPSIGFLNHDYWPYRNECARIGVKPIECEEYYRQMVRARSAYMGPIAAAAAPRCDPCATVLGRGTSKRHDVA